eukprot:3400357-Prymnesium_polylepis.1
MFVNAGPSTHNYAETINSLNFASRAKNVSLGKATKNREAEGKDEKKARRPTRRHLRNTTAEGPWRCVPTHTPPTCRTAPPLSPQPLTRASRVALCRRARRWRRPTGWARPTAAT